METEVLMSGKEDLDTNLLKPGKGEHRRELEKKAHDYTVHGLMDGGETVPESVGLIETSASATALGGAARGETKRKLKEREFHELLRMIERQIALLNDEIERLGEEIEAVREGIATKESLLEAVKSGRELTEEEKRLAERYCDDGGEIDLRALHDDLENDKKRLEELLLKQGECEAELRTLEKQRSELERKRTSGQELDESDAALAIEAGFIIEEMDTALEGYSGGDEEFAEFMESKVVSSDLRNGSVANEVATTTIGAESVKPSFNANAKGLEDLRSPKDDAVPKSGLNKSYDLS